MFNLQILFCAVLSSFVWMTSLQAQKDIDFKYYRAAMQAKAKGDHENASKDFSIFIGYYPDYAKAYYFRGYTYVYLKQFDKAREDFAEYRKRMPNDVEGVYSAGRAEYEAGEYEQAINHFSEALDIDPYHIPSWNDRGMSYCKMDQFDEGLDNFYEAIRYDSTFAMAYVNAGAARYFRQDIANPVKKDLEIAKDWFTQAIAIQPGLYLAYYNRAAVNYFLEAYPEALADLDKALRLNPMNAWTYFYQGVVYAAMGNAGRARSEYRKAVQLDPNLYYVYEEQARLSMNAESFAEAIEYYRQAKQFNDKDNDLHDGLMELRIAEAYAHM
ncbi:MAG: tetratricopeptide repeat protein, partial [Bacteroidota bacterium]